MRREESIPHPIWLTGLRLAAFVVLPLACFALFLEGGWLSSLLALALGWLVFDISGLIRLRRSNRSLGFAWTLPWQRTRRQHLLNWAFGLIATPAIMLFPLTLSFFWDPLWPFANRDSLQLFLLFYAAPWSLGALLLYRYFQSAPATSSTREQEPRAQM
jgi:hypothetical protein